MPPDKKPKRKSIVRLLVMRASRMLRPDPVPMVPPTADVHAPVTRISEHLMPKRERITSRQRLRMNDVIGERWAVNSLVGFGGYGEIYCATDVLGEVQLPVAVKIEPKMRHERLAKRIILEQKVLHELSGRPHFPVILASGTVGNLNYIVMQMLSRNLGDLRKASPFHRLSRVTTSRIMMQATAALRDLHAHGFLHRDVKPANMCFGITLEKRYEFFLVDYGLTRRFRTEHEGLRPLRRHAGFRGTHRYVSVRVHEGLDQTPVDDLTSLMYSGVEMLIGTLPWANARRTTDMVRQKMAWEAKMRIGGGACEGYGLLGPIFVEWIRVIHDMPPFSTPHYEHLIALLAKAAEGRTIVDAYDWENGWRDVNAPARSPFMPTNART